MKSRKRTETVIETHEVWVIRRAAGHQRQVLCPICEEHSLMLKPEDAASLARVNSRQIYQWIEAGQLHFTETTDGNLFVCLASVGGNII
jgi:hypothetical protein